MSLTIYDVDGELVDAGSNTDTHGERLFDGLGEPFDLYLDPEAKREFAVARQLNDLSALPDSQFQDLKAGLHRIVSELTRSEQQSTWLCRIVSWGGKHSQ